MRLWQSTVAAWEEWRFHSLRLCLSGNHSMSLGRRIHLIGIGQMKWCEWHLQVATFVGFSKLVPLTIGNGSTLDVPNGPLANGSTLWMSLPKLGIADVCQILTSYTTMMIFPPTTVDCLLQSGSAQGSSMWQSLLGYAQMRFASQIFHGSLGRWAPCDSPTELCGCGQGWLEISWLETETSYELQEQCREICICMYDIWRKTLAS